MYDPEVRVTTVVAVLFGVLSLGLVVGAWWLPYLGWFAVLCGLGVVYALLCAESHKQARLTRALWNLREESPGGPPPRPIR